MFETITWLARGAIIDAGSSCWVNEFEGCSLEQTWGGYR